MLSLPKAFSIMIISPYFGELSGAAVGRMITHLFIEGIFQIK
jgi:hypothetical protein